MAPRNPESNRAVSFNIDTLVGGTDSVCEVSDPARIITALRRLGATSIVVTAAGAEAPAAAALDNAGLAVDALYAGCRTPGQKADALAQAAVWAHLGNTASDMKAARIAGVRAVGVTPDMHPARQLRRAGADAVLKDLADFPPMFRFPGASTETLLTTRACGIKLNRHHEVIKEWLQKGWVPAVYDAWGRHRHPNDYADQLLAFTRRRRPDGRQALFATIGWAYQHGTFDARKDARAQIYNMQAKGNVYDMKQAGRLLGYSSHTIARWAAEGRIPYIDMGGQYYVRRLDVEELTRSMGLTSNEAARVLGISRDTVEQMAKLGELTLGGTPRKMRLDPREIAQAKRQRDERAAAWPGPRASKELGIKNSTLWDWGNRNIVPFQESKGQRLYDPDDVALLKQKRNQLNEGFGWVADTVKTRSYAPKQAGRILGLKPKTLHAWAADNVLPFYNLIPKELGRSDYNFISAYVDALAAYAGSLPVAKRVAREFYEVCKAAGEIWSDK